VHRNASLNKHPTPSLRAAPWRRGNPGVPRQTPVARLWIATPQARLAMTIRMQQRQPQQTPNPVIASRRLAGMAIQESQGKRLSRGSGSPRRKRGSR